MTQIKVKVVIRPRSIGQSVLVSSTHLGFTTRYLLVFDNYGPAFVGVLSDERMGLSFVHDSPALFSWVRVPLDSWQYFTVSDLRLPFSSPPTTRRVTVEVFDPASTEGFYAGLNFVQLYNPLHDPRRIHRSSLLYQVVRWLPWENVCLRSHYSAKASVYLLIQRSFPKSGFCF
jgi:hypothetical protein